METRQTLTKRVEDVLQRHHYMFSSISDGSLLNSGLIRMVLINVITLGYELGQKDAKEVLLSNKFNDLKNEQGVLNAILETGKVVNEIMIKAHMM